MNLTYPGTYKIRIKAWFSWIDGTEIKNGDKTEAIVYAVVQSGSVLPKTATSQPTTTYSQPKTPIGMVPQHIVTPQPVATVNCGQNGELCKTPGPGMTEAVFVLVALTLALRKKQTK